MDKEQFVEMIKDCRDKIKSGEYAKCPCPELKCEWHGNCKACVMIHRAYQDHVPYCMQPMLIKKIEELAKVVELNTEKKPLTPDEYWDYLNKVCPKNSR